MRSWTSLRHNQAEYAHSLKRHWLHPRLGQANLWPATISRSVSYMILYMISFTNVWYHIMISYTYLWYHAMISYNVYDIIICYMISHCDIISYMISNISYMISHMILNFKVWYHIKICDIIYFFMISYTFIWYHTMISYMISYVILIYPFLGSCDIVNFPWYHAWHHAFFTTSHDPRNG